MTKIRFRVQYTAAVMAAMLAGLTWGLLLGGCGGSKGDGGFSSSSATRSAPTALFGTWRLTATTGGFSGGGLPLDPDTEFLTFTEDGTVTHRGGVRATEQRSYRVVVRKTLFSTDDLPVVEYTDGGSSLAEVIVQADTEHLRLSEEANDGFSREYTRDTSGSDGGGGGGS